MIESFKDRRLKRLYENGDRGKIQPDLMHGSNLYWPCWTWRGAWRI